MTPELVILSLFDSKVSLAEKEEISQKLLCFKKPKDIKIKEFKPIEVKISTRLKDLINHNSWHIFKVFDVKDSWLRENPQTWADNEDYNKLKSVLKNLVSVNDCCERAIKIAQDFIDVGRKEQKYQDIVVVLKHHREMHPYTHHWDKKYLEKLL